MYTSPVEQIYYLAVSRNKELLMALNKIRLLKYESLIGLFPIYFGTYDYMKNMK